MLADCTMPKRPETAIALSLNFVVDLGVMTRHVQQIGDDLVHHPH